MKTQLRARAWFTASVLTIGLFGLAGCGGGGGYGSSMTPPPSPSPMVTSYVVKNLTSDGGVASVYTDANLKNGWGLAFNPAGYAWVADNGTSKSTLYDGNGVPQSLVVSIPAGTTGDASPTGIVFNATQDFKVSMNGLSAPSKFVFVGEAGTVSGWSPSVNPTAAITAYDGGGAGAVYKGLAISSYAGANYLYATNFHTSSVDVFDTNFAKVSLPGGFADASLPAGYAPYGIQAIADKIYVTFAKKATPDALDEITGAGLGILDVFDTSGTLLKQLVMGGQLNAPWGMAIAPANFGPLSNALLVGNFGDGKINAFNPATGAFVGTLSKADGSAVVIDGLWGIAFGNGLGGVYSEPLTTLFFTAGPGDEVHGLYGRIDTQ